MTGLEKHGTLRGRAIIRYIVCNYSNRYIRIIDSVQNCQRNLLIREKINADQNFRLGGLYDVAELFTVSFGWKE